VCSHAELICLLQKSHSEKLFSFSNEAFDSKRNSFELAPDDSVANEVAFVLLQQLGMPKNGNSSTIMILNLTLSISTAPVLLM